MKSSRRAHPKWYPAFVCSLALNSCGGGGSGSTYTVGGTVSGLASGNSVVLLDNGGDSTKVTSNTAFTFSTPIASGAQYAVTVGTQPAGQTCTVAAGSGVMGAANIVNVGVDCLYTTGSSLNLVYVTDSGNSTIPAFTVDYYTGALTLVTGSPFSGCASAYSIAIDPAQRYAFCLSSVGGYVTTYAIEAASGALTQIAGGPFFTGATPVALSVDISAHFLVTANSGGNSVSAFSIAASGAMTEIAGSPFAAGSQPSAIMFEPRGKFLYVANAGDNTISAYSLNAATGQLTAVAGSPFAAGGMHPQSIAIDPTGASLYVANFLSSTISGFAINLVNGALTPIPGSPFPDGGGIAVVVDRTGGFVYVANGANVPGFARDLNTGALTALPGSPFVGGPNATSLAVDASGQYLYVLDNVNDEVRGFSIDKSSGAFSTVAGSPFALVPGKQGLGPTVIVTSQP